MSKPFVYASSMEKGKIAVSIGPDKHTTRLLFSYDEALEFAADLTEAAAKVSRQREGTPADLGCEVL